MSINVRWQISWVWIQLHFNQLYMSVCFGGHIVGSRNCDMKIGILTQHNFQLLTRAVPSRMDKLSRQAQDFRIGGK